MNNFLKTSLFVLSPVVLLLFFGSCEDLAKTTEPVKLVFNTTAATFNGTPIDPLPDYRLTLHFDEEGNPSNFSSSGTAAILPPIGNSGTWEPTANMLTFTSSGDSRSISVSNSVGTETTSVSLTWSLTKIDDGVTAAEQGEYIFTLEVE